MIQNILLAVNCTQYHNAAPDFAFSLARRLNFAVYVVIVIDIEKETTNADLGIMPEDSKKKLEQVSQMHYQDIINKYQSDIKTKLFIPEGNPKDEIIRLANELNSEMIVVARDNKKGIIHKLFGNLSEHIAENSRIPVVIVPED